MSLRTAIDKLQAREQDAQAIREDRDGFIKEWRDDLNNLYNLIINIYLKEFVDDRSLSAHIYEMNVKEDDLGEYWVPALRLDITDKSIKLTPRGRVTIDSTGRLDLWRTDRPSLSDRIRLIRNIAKGGERGNWIIEGVPKQSQHLPGVSVTPFVSSILGISREVSYVALGQSSFEDALERLLKA